MTLEELRALLGEGAKGVEDTVLQTLLDSISNNEKGLKTKNTDLLAKISGLKKTQLPEDFDAEAFADYLKNKGTLDTQKQEIEDKRLADEGQWDALKLQLVEGHNTAITTLATDKDGIISGLRKTLDSELIQNSALKAIESEKGLSKFLLPHITPQVQTVEVDGKYSIQIIDGEGQPRLDDKGEAFTMKSLVAEMKADESFGPAFIDGNNGSGNPPNGGANLGSKVNPWKKETKNITAQAVMQRDNPTLAEQMKKAAGQS